MARGETFWWSWQVAGGRGRWQVTVGKSRMLLHLQHLVGEPIAPVRTLLPALLLACHRLAGGGADHLPRRDCHLSVGAAASAA